MKRKSILFLFTLFLTGFLFSCTDKQEHIPPFLTIETQTLNFNSVSTTRDIPVKTSIENWTVMVQPDARTWMEATRIGSILRVVVSENTEFESRHGEIRVVADDLSETITVVQLGPLLKKVNGCK